MKETLTLGQTSGTKQALHDRLEYLKDVFRGNNSEYAVSIIKTEIKELEQVIAIIGDNKWISIETKELA